VSIQKTKENEFMQLHRGGMSVLEYASKFIELSHFAPAFVADERLKMNRFEAWINLGIKERISVQQYTFYVDLYDIAVNVERVMRERSNYFNEQYRIKRRGVNERKLHPKVQDRRPPGNPYPNKNARGGQHPNTRPTLCSKMSLD